MTGRKASSYLLTCPRTKQRFCCGSSIPFRLFSFTPTVKIVCLFDSILLCACLFVVLPLLVDSKLLHVTAILRVCICTTFARSECIYRCSQLLPDESSMLSTGESIMPRFINQSNRSFIDRPEIVLLLSLPPSPRKMIEQGHLPFRLRSLK